jgi:DNA-nicking Smr family endonuclease
VKKKRGSDAQKGGHPAAPFDDDQQVWQYAAATIEPLKRAKGRFHPANEAAASRAQKPKPNSPSERPPAKKKVALEPAETTVQKSSRVAAPDLALFDRNAARKIRGGRVEIEARVDLHGMRQQEAHARLKGFLLSCQGRGLRYVLIITGKGKAIGSQASHTGEADRERGILKRNVPRWLEEPDLRAVVVSFTVAAVQHGGEGAIYVHLRSKNRA